MLYVLGRDLERTEHLARLVRVHFELSLDRSVHPERRFWANLLQLAGWPAPDAVVRDHAIAMVLGDPSGPSLRQTLESARRAAQAVRPSLSIEVWEQVNALYWRLSDAGWQGEPYTYLHQVELGTQLVAGLVDDTMAHDEAWHFVKLGKHLERAGNVTHLVTRKSRELAEAGEDPIAWASVLRSCASLEAFRLRYGVATGAQTVARFLLLDRMIPRSASYCLAAALTAVEGIDRRGGTSPPHRVLGRLAASFEHADPVEVGASPQRLAAHFDEQWADLHRALRSSYFQPSQLALELAGDQLSRHPQQQQQS
ncbi:MAG TPA: alpha-E domain-containing protein [Candidatus Dormibacteraeota bacterium]